MHKNPRQKPHSVSKIRNSVVPCAFAIQHQSGTWRDSDEYGWSSKNVQTDWHPLPPLVDHNVHGFSPLLFPHSLQARLTFNAYWNSWNSLVRFALWWRRGSMGGAKRIFFVLWKKCNVKRELWKSMLLQSNCFERFQPCSCIFKKIMDGWFVFFVGYFMKKVNFHLACTDDLEVFQSCPIRCDPNQKWRPLLLKPGLLELQFERTQGRKIQDAPIVWVYQLIHAKYFTSSDPHQVACHHDIAFCILFDKYSDSFHSDMPFG